MTELEKLARWHDLKADFWRGEAIVKLPTEAAEHTAAAATIRAAMAEIERLRGPVTQYVKGYGPGDGVSALAAQTKEPTDD